MRGAPSRSWIGLAGSAGLGFALLAGAPLAGAYVGVGIQPAIEADYTTITFFGGPGGSDTLVFGNEQLEFSNGFTAPPPPSGVNGCSGSVAALAGVGMPAAPTLVNDAYATVHCPAESDVGPSIYSSGEADSMLLYKIKGPAATYSSTAVRLGGTLHGSLSGSLDFGQPANNAST